MDRPLRFCMVTTFYPPYSFGGDAIFVYQLANELARRGHTVHVVHSQDAYFLRERRVPSVDFANHPNVTVHGLKSGFGFLAALATQQLGSPCFHAAEIRRVLDQGFDVIHFHNISLVGGPEVLTYGRGIKLYTMHEYWLVCQTHVLFRFNTAACVHPRCLLCSLTYGRPPQWWRYGRLMKSAIEHVDAFLSPSRFGREVHSRMGMDLPIVRLANFVPAVEPAAPSEVHGADPYFLFVGRLEKLKGLQTIIPLFRSYRKAKLLVAGAGSFEPQLQRLAQGSPNIRFVGTTSQRDLQPLYRGAVAVIVPSICFEAFPLVLIEAFRQQTPVIARNLGGTPEILEESRGGIAFDTQDQLIAAMDRLLADPAERHTLGMNGYAAFQARWTPETHLRQYLALIEEIAARKAGAGRPARTTG